MYGADFGKGLGGLFTLAVIGLCTVAAGIIYGIWWLIEHVRFV